MGALRKVRRGIAYPLRRWPRLTKLTLGGAALLVLFVAFANAYVVLSADQHSTGEVAEVPPAEVAIVPGAGVRWD
ncbi:MAG TPA: hypothetical protein VFB52_09250, partial [Solirubrobacterales bacterium]|nr:hypothetical protein [Solirubrobacterales bacterium]